MGRAGRLKDPGLVPVLPEVRVRTMPAISILVASPAAPNGEDGA